MPFESLLNNESFTKEELIQILSDREPENVTLLFNKANDIRRRYCTDEIKTFGLIQFSNYCDKNCSYCRYGNDASAEFNYRMDPEEIIDNARQVSNSGIKTILIQSGHDPYYDSDLISYIVFSIKKKSNIRVILSVGERSEEEYRNWNLAGVDSYLIRHETACNEIDLNNESNSIGDCQERQSNFIKAAGMNVGFNNLIGVPGSKIDQVAEKILLMNETGVKFSIFSPFAPIPNTPLEKKLPGSRFQTLIAMALARIVMKNIDIPALPMAYITDNQRNERGFGIGANVLVTDFTPLKYKDSQFLSPCNQYAKHVSKISSYFNIKKDIAL